MNLFVKKQFKKPMLCLDLDQQWIFVIFHFSFCPAVWMLHSQKFLSEQNIGILTHLWGTTESLQKLMVEIFKIKAGMSLELMKCVFRFADVPFHLSNRSKYNRSIPCTKRSKLWGKVPTETKNSKFVEEFKKRIKSWGPKNYIYKIYKLFIKHVAYL